jgi:hypothetical protein
MKIRYSTATPWLGVFVLGAFLLGCGSGDANSATNGVASGEKKPVLDTNTEKPADPGLSLDKIPADLKTDAYEYYGLGKAGDMNLVLKSGKNEPQTGTQTVKLTKADAGRCEFEVSYGGVLAQQGKMTMSLDKGGVRVIASDTIKQDPKTYELPSGLKPGLKWDTKTVAGSEIEVNSTNTVVGTQTVTTPVATYKDALLVVATGTGKNRGTPFKMESKIWLVKGRGAVRTEIVNSSGGKTETSTLEEAK